MTKIDMCEAISAAAFLLEAAGVERRRCSLDCQDGGSGPKRWGARRTAYAQVSLLCRHLSEDLDPARRPSVSEDHGAALCIDMAGGIGQLGMKLALELGPQRAKKYGVATVGVGRTS